MDLLDVLIVDIGQTFSPAYDLDAGRATLFTCEERRIRCRRLRIKGRLGRRCRSRRGKGTSEIQRAFRESHLRRGNVVLGPLHTESGIP
jgi:hypothetical protein